MFGLPILSMKLNYLDLAYFIKLKTLLVIVANKTIHS